MKFVNAIVCDDVRIEGNGKHILIGVYPADVRISGQAANIALTFWFVATDYVPGETKFEMRLSLDGEKLVDGEITAVMREDTDRTTLILPNVPSHIARSGIMKLELRQEGTKAWKQVTSIPVSLNQQPS